jgi:hypothetical protein
VLGDDCGRRGDEENATVDVELKREAKSVIERIVNLRDSL